MDSNGELCVAILLNDISNLKPITLLRASRSGTPISAALKEYYNLEVHIAKLLTYNQIICGSCMQSTACVDVGVVLLIQGLSLHDMGGGTGPADPVTAGPMFAQWCLNASRCDLRGPKIYSKIFPHFMRIISYFAHGCL